MISHLEATVRIPESVLFRDLGGEAVLLDMEAGKYFTLDEVGARMWALLQQHGVVATTYEALLNEYNVSQEQLHQDLVGFVELLVSRNLLTVNQDD